MQKYLKYVLLGFIIAFTIVFIILFSINLYMSKIEIEFSENIEYETKLVEIEERLNDIVEVNSCIDSIVEFKDLSKETYFKESMKTEEWVRLFYSDAYRPLEDLSNILKNCNITESDRSEIVSSFLLVNTTYEEITNKAVYSYELSFSDVFFRNVFASDISSFSYRMAKLQELYILDNVLDIVVGDNND